MLVSLTTSRVVSTKGGEIQKLMRDYSLTPEMVAEILSLSNPEDVTDFINGRRYLIKEQIDTLEGKLGLPCNTVIELKLANFCLVDEQAQRFGMNFSLAYAWWVAFTDEGSLEVPQDFQNRFDEAVRESIRRQAGLLPEV